MVDKNLVQLSGVIDTEIEVKTTKNGSPMASFRLAVTSEGKKWPNRYRIVLWGSTAYQVDQLQLMKGDYIGLTGKLDVMSFKNQAGENIYVTQIVADTLTSTKQLPMVVAPAALQEPPAKRQAEPLNPLDEIPF